MMKAIRWAILALFLPLVCCERNHHAKLAGDYPSVDGSTSTHPMSMLIACKIKGVAYHWERPPALERTVFPDRGNNPLRADWIEKHIQHHGTHEGYMNLISGNADLIFVARAPSVREIEEGRRRGVIFDVKPIALDALVFVVHVNNPVDNLSLSQIRSIFGPEPPKTWTEFGGRDEPVEAFQREEDSGSQELMQKLIMKEMPIRSPEEIPVIYTMAGVINTIAIRERGIAYTIYYYFTNMAPNKAVKMIRIDGVMPEAGTIESLKYPLTTEVYAVFRKGMNKESSAAQLREWLVTADGRTAILESGYVPMPAQSR